MEGRSLNQDRVVIFIQVLNSFVGGILGVALPLMMRERNIDIVTIGFVFASMPMIFSWGECSLPRSLIFGVENHSLFYMDG